MKHHDEFYHPAPSSAPSFTASFSVDASTVALQWSPPPPDTHNGIVRKYIVNATAVQTGVSTLTNITGTTGIIVSLIPSFTYTFSVSAFTVSAGPYSAEVTISLPEDGEPYTNCFHLYSQSFAFSAKGLSQRCHGHIQFTVFYISLMV